MSIADAIEGTPTVNPLFMKATTYYLLRPSFQPEKR